jgi:transposase-like protein
VKQYKTARLWDRDGKPLATSKAAPEMPRCPRCQKPMAVIRTWLKSSGFHEYRTYQCFACVETMTIGLEHSASPGLR